MKKYFVSLLEIGVKFLDKNVQNIDTTIDSQKLPGIIPGRLSVGMVSCQDSEIMYKII